MDNIYCPKCNSTHITTNQKGFSAGKALAGAVLTGGIGLLAGTIGSKKIVITCLNCGKQFKPGAGAKAPASKVDKPISMNVDLKFPIPEQLLKEPPVLWDSERGKHIANPNFVKVVSPAEASYERKLILSCFFGLLSVGIICIISDVSTAVSATFLILALCFFPSAIKRF